MFTRRCPTPDRTFFLFGPHSTGKSTGIRTAIRVDVNYALRDRGIEGGRRGDHGHRGPVYVAGDDGPHGGEPHRVGRRRRGERDQHYAVNNAVYWVNSALSPILYSFEAVAMTKHHYTVVLEREADGGFRAFCPALKGCHSEGDTIDEAVSNVREAIEAYLESLAARGEPIPVEDLLIKPVEVAL